MRILGQQMGVIHELAKAKYLLDNGCAVVVFRKKNNEIRVMLCTRSPITCGAVGLEAHIGNKNEASLEANGNITVMDLIAGETRIFNINRVMYSLWMLEVANPDEVEMIFEAYNFCKEQWPQYDDLDPIKQSVFLNTFSYPGFNH